MPFEETIYHQRLRLQERFSSVSVNQESTGVALKRLLCPICLGVAKNRILCVHETFALRGIAGDGDSGCNSNANISSNAQNSTIDNCNPDMDVDYSDNGSDKSERFVSNEGARTWVLTPKSCT